MFGAQTNIWGRTWTRPGTGWRPWPEAQARGPYFFFPNKNNMGRAPGPKVSSEGLWAWSQGLQPVPGLVQVQPQMSVRAQIIKNGLKRIQNRRFGVKISPEACQDRSGAFRIGPATQKEVKKSALAAPGTET